MKIMGIFEKRVIVMGNMSDNYYILRGGQVLGTTLI